jgi:hypothetical protein
LAYSNSISQQAAGEVYEPSRSLVPAVSAGRLSWNFVISISIRIKTSSVFVVMIFMGKWETIFQFNKPAGCRRE